MNDTISRQAVLNEFCHSCDGWNCNPNTCCKTEWIRKLPPIQPKRETTTLRIGRTRNSVTMWYECVECGEPVDQEDAFCRRCGRRIIHE